MVSRRLRYFGLFLISMWSFALLCVQPLTRIEIDYPSFMFVLLSIPLLAFGARHLSRKDMLKAALLCEALALCLSFSVLVLVSSYFAMAVSRPLSDNFLLSVDQSMGFNGMALLRGVDTLPVLAQLLELSYSSFAVQLLFLPLVLIAVGKPNNGLCLVLTYGVAGLMCCVISIWFPAIGTGQAYQVSAAGLHSVNAHYFFAFLQEFYSVRSQDYFLLSLQRAQGILTFPSVHSAVAVTCAFHCFRVPLLRYPVLLLNALMLLSTLTHGGHYLVDVLAGSTVALAAILTVSLVRTGVDGAKTSVSLQGQSTF